MLELPWEARWVVLELPWIVLVALVLCFLALGCDVLWWSSLWTEFDCWPLKTTSDCFPLTTWKCPVLMALNVTSSPLPTFPILMWRLAQLKLTHNNPFPFLFLLCCWSRVFMVPSFFSPQIPYIYNLIQSFQVLFGENRLLLLTPAWGSCWCTSKHWGWVLLLCRIAACVLRSHGDTGSSPPPGETVLTLSSLLLGGQTLPGLQNV